MLEGMTDGTAGNIIGNTAVIKGGVTGVELLHGYTATGCGNMTSGDGDTSADETSEIKNIVSNGRDRHWFYITTSILSYLQNSKRLTRIEPALH